MTAPAPDDLDTQTAYLAFVSKRDAVPYSHSPRWIPRPFATSHLRPGDRVRVWDEAAMGREGTVIELRQNDALIELVGVSAWVRASALELLDESVLLGR